ncbi:MAG TPA: tetratricopeptide repeat protein [Rhodanobacteraceae bacterium]|nr:tetratricopeptide repeat protein [Rhodanobacteraceae bacterium]
MKRNPWPAMLAAACLLAGCASQQPVQPPASSSLLRTDVKHSTITVGDPTQGKVDQAYLAKVMQALKMIQANQTQQAIDGPLNDVIRHYEKTYANRGVTVYSAKDPTRSLAYLAGAAVAAEDAEKAGKQGRNAIVVGPAWAMAHWAKGYAYDALGQYGQARNELEQALALAPMNSQYASELAYTYLKDGNWNKALSLYQEAEANAELAPESAAVHLKCVALRGQGYALVELHHLDDAVKAYKSCLKLNPDDPKSHGELRYIESLRNRHPPDPLQKYLNPAQPGSESTK